jgi:hypothetical protein
MASTINGTSTGSGGLITTGDDSGILNIQTNETTAITIDASQAVTMAGRTTNPTTISVGAATPSTSGAGITFPAAQSASSNANTLDDYEEGTYTPTASSSAGAITTYSSAGTYTKIGRQVFLSANVYIANAGTASGSLIISMPFSSPNTADQFFYGVGSETLATGTGYQVYIAPNSSASVMVTYAGLGITWANARNYAFNITFFVS